MTSDVDTQTGSVPDSWRVQAVELLPIVVGGTALSMAVGVLAGYSPWDAGLLFIGLWVPATVMFAVADYLGT